MNSMVNRNKLKFTRIISSMPAYFYLKIYLNVNNNFQFCSLKMMQDRSVSQAHASENKF